MIAGRGIKLLTTYKKKKTKTFSGSDGIRNVYLEAGFGNDLVSIYKLECAFFSFLDKE